MRLFSILTAIVAMAAVYVFVFERERLTAMLPAPAAEAVDADAQTANPDATVDSFGPVGVVALRSSARAIGKAVTVRGRTEADRKVAVRAETSGQVISEPRPEGSFVNAGDTICKLDPGARQSALTEARARLAEAQARVPEAQARVPESRARVQVARAQIEQAKAQLEEARINANAAERLIEDGYASQTRVAATRAVVRGAEAAIETARASLKSAESNRQSVAAGIEAAKAGVQAARAAVANAEREIELLTITAPFSGVQESDVAEMGSLLRPGDLCATVLRLDPIKLVGFVSETQVARLELGASATARLASGETAEGKVTFVSRAADPQTRTFRVEAEAPNPDLTLRDGQTAAIEIAAEGTKAHLLPASALTLNDAGQLGVRIVDADRRAKFIPVTLVRDTPRGAWLTGLPERAEVIVIGQEYVTDGVRVLPEYRELGQ